jgi:hypothetical protein
MSNSHHPLSSEIMLEARRALDARIRRYDVADSPSPHDIARMLVRRERSLRCCHRPKDDWRTFEPPADSDAFVPQLSARLENDRNLTDGARRCGRKLAEIAYRQKRSCYLEITVTFLMKALRRCRRTIQRYLRELERAGYIKAFVRDTERTRMSAGLLVRLCGAMLPRHGWPERRNPGATFESHKNAEEDKGRRIPVQMWALRCMDGVFRSFIATIPPFPGIAEGQAGTANGGACG